MGTEGLDKGVESGKWMMVDGRLEGENEEVEM